MRQCDGLRRGVEHNALRADVRMLGVYHRSSMAGNGLIRQRWDGSVGSSARHPASEAATRHLRALDCGHKIAGSITPPLAYCTNQSMNVPPIECAAVSVWACRAAIPPDNPVPSYAPP